MRPRVNQNVRGWGIADCGVRYKDGVDSLSTPQVDFSTVIERENRETPSYKNLKENGTKPRCLPKISFIILL